MKSGSYRAPLISVLSTTNPELCRMLETKTLMLAHAHSASVGVTIRLDLVATLVAALEQADDKLYAAEKAYYIAKLMDGSAVPVLSAGVDYIATGNTEAEATTRLEKARAATSEKEWAPGELYMKS